MATRKPRATPRLADSNLMRYLGSMFKLDLSMFHEFDDAMAEIVSCRNIPEGLNDAVLLYERHNVRGVLWNLTERSELVQSSLHLIPENDGGAYLLLVDDSLPGKDGLILCSSAVSRDSESASADNIVYMTESWSRMGKPANIMSGSCKLRDGCVFSAVAVQLSSLDMEKDSN